jgi:hypothetical protein
MTQSNSLETPPATLEGTENPYEIKNLDHLGLIAAQFDDLGLVEQIDSMVPQDKEKRTVSLGQTVKELKSAIHKRREGVWACKNTRKIVQYMIHELGEFLTKAETLSLSLTDRDSSFPDFADLLVELRIKMWSAVARLYLMYGEAVQPYHLPEEILKEQKKAIYLIRDRELLK